MISTQGDLRQSLLQKAQELFALCDRQGKGYALKEELGALGNELPLSQDQLQDVFDALDVDGDGRLTLQEFSDGFGMFLGIDGQPFDSSSNFQVEEEEDEDEVLEELLDHLGARNLFTDEDYVREMWRRVRKDDPVMLSNFENFISRMAADLRQTAEDKESLQNALKYREQENESRVQSLYAEMEEQLRQEKEEALDRERRKEQQLRDELETEVQIKNNQLQDLLQKHAEMEKQLKELNSNDSEKKYENKKLQKDRDILESRLAASERLLQDMKGHLNLLRKKSLEEKRKRAQSALKVSEGIALERENLVLELQQLKEINKQLLDEKDELAQSAAQLIPVQNIYQRTQSPKHSRQYASVSHSEGIREELQTGKNHFEHPLAFKEPTESENHSYNNSLPFLESKFESFDEEEIDNNIRNNLNTPTEREAKDAIKKNNRSRTKEIDKSSSQTYPKFNKYIKSNSPNESTDPTRVFKVVFVGDSGVGKTSILQRFCNDAFKPTFNATIGVDFQVKTVNIEGETFALQLWDTAGQERFRSMTQLYFRKADGIIVVYDVTSEVSFRNVRNWMDDIQEGAENTNAILLMGNKIDLCESDDNRVIKTKDGERLADEYGTLFYESSAKTGNSIEEAIGALACLLKSKEDESIEQVLRLQEEIKGKKKKCC